MLYFIFSVGLSFSSEYFILLPSIMSPSGRLSQFVQENHHSILPEGRPREQSDFNLSSPEDEFPLGLDHSSTATEVHSNVQQMFSLQMFSLEPVERERLWIQCIGPDPAPLSLSAYLLLRLQQCVLSLFRSAVFLIAASYSSLL